MPKNKLPLEINYVELYYTFSCNLNCSYCINTHSELQRKRPILDNRILAAWLNNIDFRDVSLTIGGGEPTIRKDFYELLDLLEPHIKIDLLTNLQFDEKEFIKRIHPNKFYSDISKSAYKSLRVSYHPSTMDPQKLIKKATCLQEAGFNIGVFGINHPLNMIANIEMAEIARKSQIYFFIKDFLGEYKNVLFGFYKYAEGLNKVQKTCLCRTKELLISFDGKIYKCHRDLYASEYAIGTVQNSYQPEYTFRECNVFGNCNPCDIKLKANRFLQMGSCSVEIKQKNNL